MKLDRLLLAGLAAIGIITTTTWLVDVVPRAAEWLFLRSGIGVGS